MAKQVNMYWSDETMSKAEQIMIAKRASSGQNITRTQLVAELVENAYTSLKRIEAVYGPGKRGSSRLIGWAAYYGEHLVTTTDGAGSKPQAQKALDAFVYEELSK